MYIIKEKVGVRAMSLVEIIVAMGIIAVIIILAIVGIVQLQRASRDSDRQTTVSKIAELIGDFRKENLRLPSEMQVEFNGDNVSIGSDMVIDLKGANKSSPQTDGNGTKYVYNLENGQFAICAKLESGGTTKAGDGKCPDTW